MTQINDTKNTKKANNFKELLPFLKPYRMEIFFAFVALFITALMVLLFGRIIKHLIDSGFSKGDFSEIHTTLLFFLLSVIIMAIAGYFRSSLVNSVAEKVIANLRKKAYSHVVRISPEFFELNKTGDIISRLTVDTAILYTIISNTVSFLLRNTIFFVGGIVLLFFTSIKLTIISFILIFIAISPIVFLGKKIKKYSSNSQASIDLLSSRIEETVSGIKTIQAFGCEEKEINNFSNRADIFLKNSLDKIRIKALMVALVISFAFGAVAVVLFVGGNDIINGNITAGELSSFIFYSVIIATSLVSISQIAGQLQTASSSLSRIFNLLKVESAVQEAAFPKHFAASKNVVIKFENVDFAYIADKDNKILENFNLEIKPQEKIAIVGPSGSGKSTIFQLLLRFYDCQNGKISLNDEDIKVASFSSLRSNFSYISQDCFIFSDTILNNISYANPNATKEEVLKLISQTKLLDFVDKLPNGVENFVGQKGVKLSGGERQRIAIMRAILQNSPVLLLDEATSALDNENEKIVADLIENVAVDKTVVIIAHKLSTIINCDRIIYLQDGKIVEEGTHKELIKKNGFYKKMYEVEISSEEISNQDE
jgi:ATP-binding cassette, subfamily B, bacterial